jgi:hypothetical protein
VAVKRESLRLSPKQMQAAWAELADKDAARAVQGCALLYGAQTVLPFLKEHLKATAKIPDADEKAVAVLIGQLDSDDMATREKASAELAKLGLAAVPAVEEALKHPRSVEQRMRLQHVLAKATDAPALTQARRGLEVLVALATPEARDLLQTLGKGPERAWLSHAARNAAERATR